MELSAAAEGEMKNDRTNERWGYCDTNGNLAIKAQYLSAQQFSDGLAIVQMALDNKLWGAINHKGEIILEAHCYKLGIFFNGPARAILSKEHTDYEEHTVSFNSGYINKIGSLVIKWDLRNIKFNLASDFSSDLASVRVHVTLQEAIALAEGKPQVIEKIKSFTRLRNDVKTLTEHNSCGYINREGSIVINGKYGYINKSGEEIIGFNF